MRGNPPNGVRLTPVPALDGVRAIAVSLVLLFHAGHLDGGFLGVDLFFTLSGYLITALLLDELAATRRIALGSFWWRRARRLLPGLVVMIGATLLAVGVLYGLDDVRANRDEAIASLFYLSNWRSIVAPPSYLTIFQHTWSLSIEAQFYLLWPLVVLAVGRRSPDRSARRVLIVAAVAAGAGTAVMAILHGGPESVARVYFGTDTRATPILLGAAVAASVRCWGAPARARAVALRVAGWVALTGIGAIVIVARRPDDVLYEGGYALFNMLTATFIASVALSSGLLSRGLALGPLRWLGVISYGVYLWHWPVFYLVNAERARLSGWPLFALQCLVTLVIAGTSYGLIERPIRRFRTTPPNPRPASAQGSDSTSTATSL